MHEGTRGLLELALHPTSINAKYNVLTATETTTPAIAEIHSPQRLFTPKKLLSLKKRLIDDATCYSDILN